MSKLLYLIFSKSRYSVFVWLLLAVLLKQIIWVGLVPIWHFPDEPSHYAQVQNVATFGIKYYGPSSDEIITSEKLLGVFRNELGRNNFTLNPAYNLEYSNNDVGIYENTIKSLSPEYVTEGMVFEATSYPFLYYWISGSFFNFVQDLDLFTKVIAVRFFSVLLFLTTVLVAYLIGKITFNNKVMAIALASLTAFQPMFSFVGSSINSDVLFNLIFAVFLYGCLKVLNRPTLISWLILFGSLVVGFLTKQQMAIALLILPFVILFQIPAIYRTIRRKPILTLCLGLILLGIIVKFAQMGDVIRIYSYIEAGSYDNPLQNVSLGEHLQWTLIHTYREVIPWYWGVFKWLGVTLPRWSHRIQMEILGLTGIGIVYYLSIVMKNVVKKKLPNFSGQDKSILFLVFAAFMYFMALTIWDWFFRRSYGFSFGLQGRYFFPVLTAHMAIILLSFKTLGEKLIGLDRVIILIKVVVMWWIGLQIIGLWTVAQAYYDVSSWHNFIVQASQYKPIMFKSHWWSVWMGLSMVATLAFIIQYLRNYDGNQMKSDIFLERKKKS